MRHINAVKCSIVGASIALAGGLVSAANMAAVSGTFEGLGFPTSATESKARDVSDNGVVVGLCLIPPDNSTPTTGYRAIRLTGSGFENLGTIGGDPYWFSSSQGVSADGSVIVGASSTASGQRAFRWTAGTGMVSLGTLPRDASSQAHGVSSDGSVVVGKSTSSRGVDRAFRWTNAGGMVSLGTLKRGTYSEAWAASANGSVVAGLGDSSNGDRAFRWTSAGMQDLGPAVSRNTSKGDISGNGLVVVGATGSASNPVTSDRAFRWTAGTGMVSLGTLQSGWGSWATGVNADGSAVVGSSGPESHPSDARHAFLWTSALGMVDLNSYLPAIGIDLAGWTLVEADAVSSDGTIIAGYGIHVINGNGQSEAWIVRLVP